MHASAATRQSLGSDTPVKLSTPGAHIHKDLAVSLSAAIGFLGW